MANEKLLGKKVDALYDIQQALDKEEAALNKKKEKFKQDKLKLMGELNKQKLKQIKGVRALMTIQKRNTIVIDDFDKLWAFIKKKDARDLLPRKVNSKAVKERLENKEKLPFLHLDTINVPVLRSSKGGG